MGICVGIKALRLGNRKTFRIMLLVETVLVLMGIAGLFGKDAVYEYGLEAARVNFGTFSEEQGGIYADHLDQKGNLVDFVGIALPKGTYQVQLRYATDQDMVHSYVVTDSVLGQKNIRTNGYVLFSGLSSTDFAMWLLRDSEETMVSAYYGGTGTLAVQGLTIRQTNAWNRIILFGILCLSAVVNCAYAYMQYDRAYHIPVTNKTVTFCLGLTILVASVPIMADYMLWGGDLVYHLMRVEGIRDGLVAGQFPIRISPEWQQGYGYASPVFYGETVLYLAGLLRLVGFTVTDSYRIFMFLVVAATVQIAYFCYRRIFGEPFIGIFCSMMHTLSIYRIYKTWICGSWGECFGIMFLPLIVYGFWRVFTEDIREEGYRRSWLPLTVGFTMLLQSHLLTCELVGLFTILLCAVLWKRVFRLQTFVVLAKTVIYSVLLSAWFLVPFVDYMATGDFVIQHVSARTIQWRGLFPAHLLLTYLISGETVFFDTGGMADSVAVGLGVAPIATLVILVWLWLWGDGGRLRREERVLGRIVGGFAILAMAMSLSLFPWDRIQALSDMTATLVSSIQFPSRFLTIANVCLTTAAGVAAKYVLEHKGRLLVACYFGGMTVLVLISSTYLQDNMMNRVSLPVRVYNHEGMGTGYIAGSEYLPYGANASLFRYHDPIITEGITVGGYEKMSLGAEARVANTGDADGRMAFPLLYYKGYHAYDVDSGKELRCYAGDNFEVTVDIPAGFAGNVRVRFEAPWYWRTGEMVTAAALIVMATFFWRKRRGMGDRKRLHGGVCHGE